MDRHDRTHPWPGTSAEEGEEPRDTNASGRNGEAGAKGGLGEDWAFGTEEEKATLIGTTDERVGPRGLWA
jgi:hypothetical protein